ncbi:MAG TPA: hypothetical protein ENH00_12800, partial [Actinobacteria bacterium]|nr:hypothetical protein [Actinomycetota bacterium]
MRTIRLVIVIALVVSACSSTSRVPDRTPGGPRDLGRSTTLPDGTADATSPPTTIAQPDGSEEATVVEVFDG